MDAEKKSYTKKGDDGHTCLGNGVRQPKSHKLLEAVGAIDEMSSVIGLAKVHMEKKDEQLEKIQKNLVEAGAIISKFWKNEKAMEFEEKTNELEKWIDEIDGKLPKLDKFILPGGCVASVYLQYARAIARKAERRVQELEDKELGEVLIYLNRLSSYFFAKARIENIRCGIGEESKYKGEISQTKLAEEEKND
ncbi:MAG: cob(I)yrinic acid a,c-diamide adenosyltransferase [Candidatus Micrarchaeota archaeon]